MYIAILGRQPAIGMAELEKLYGPQYTKWFSQQSVTIEVDNFKLSRLGGTQKAGRVVMELPKSNWRDISTKIVQSYTQTWSDIDYKITLGISAYGFNADPREIQKTGISLKQNLKKKNVSLRLIPNNASELNTATSHHNKLGLSDNKVELLIIRAPNGRVIIAESVGAQNITAYTRRDQNRPKRDAFVGMLPPKLAQIIINLASPIRPAASQPSVLLDPFCGTGVILQEAALMGYNVYGTDISPKMVEYSTINMAWLEKTHAINPKITIQQGDAIKMDWRQPITIVACEAYLGQPFSAPPSSLKLDQVRKNCDYIIGSFLKNLSTQIQSGTPLCIAIPAWRDESGQFTHLPLTHQLEALGYTLHQFEHVKREDLLYYRDEQIVARELLVLVKS